MAAIDSNPIFEDINTVKDIYSFIDPTPEGCKDFDINADHIFPCLNEYNYKEIPVVNHSFISYIFGYASVNKVLFFGYASSNKVGLKNHCITIHSVDNFRKLSLLCFHH